MSVYQAAEVLGVTVDAIRKRISRDTIPHERDEHGRVWVILDTDQDTASKVQDADRPQSDSGALISEMRHRIESLERQLEQERQANSEHRRLLAAALERIPPQLEAPSEAGESTPTVEEEQELDTERVRREMAESTLREGMDEEARRREEAERERDRLRRELFALRQQRESPETAEDASAGAEPRPATGEAQEDVQRRPWWRRVFGG